MIVGRCNRAAPSLNPPNVDIGRGKDDSLRTRLHSLGVTLLTDSDSSAAVNVGTAAGAGRLKRKTPRSSIRAVRVRNPVYSTLPVLLEEIG